MVVGGVLGGFLGGLGKAALPALFSLLIFSRICRIGPVVNLKNGFIES